MDRKDASSEQHWTKIIEQARRHPAGVKDYCKTRGISVNTYYGWYKRLRPKHREWTDLSNGPALRARMNSASETEVIERPTRRTFTKAYKTKILKEIDLAPAGKASVIMRREGLYSSSIQKWRKEFSMGEGAPVKRGPKANPSAAEIKRLRNENARLQKKLAQAGYIIELQKKIAQILGSTVEESRDED